MTINQNYPAYPPQPTGAEEPDDQYDQAILLPRRERLFTKVTWAMAALLFAGGSFALGAHLKNTPAAAAAGTVSAQSANAQGARGQNGTTGTAPGGATGAATNGSAAAGGFGGGTVGQITAINGNTITLKDNQGNTVTINATATTPINVAKPGALSDLSTGETIVVQGTAGSSGAINATSINAGTAFSTRAGIGTRGGAGGINAPSGAAPTTTAG